MSYHIDHFDAGADVSADESVAGQKAKEEARESQTSRGIERESAVPGLRIVA